MELTWKHIAAYDPEFVQWVVQRYGPLPDGPVNEADYERYLAAFNGRGVEP